jgi:futalosine hydrolase
MNILICAPTVPEMDCIAQLNLPQHHNFELGISGLGSMHSTFYLQTKIQQQQWDLIVQIGLAGTYSPHISLGQVVMVNKDCLADLGAFNNKEFTPFSTTPLFDGNDFPYKNNYLENKNPLLKTMPYEVVQGSTVNCLSNNPDVLNAFAEAYNPEIETMEGAALHYVCLQNDVPFLQLRAISNHVGDRNKANWKISEALANLGAAVQELCNNL